MSQFIEKFIGLNAKPISRKIPECLYEAALNTSYY